MRGTAAPAGAPCSPSRGGGRPPPRGARKLACPSSAGRTPRRRAHSSAVAACLRHPEPRGVGEQPPDQPGALRRGAEHVGEDVEPVHRPLGMAPRASSGRCPIRGSDQLLAALLYWGLTVRCRFVVGMALFGSSGRATVMAAIRRQNPGNPLARFDGIYDLYRDCTLNQLYYGHRLNWFTRAGLTLEIVIVIGSGASGVAGWIIWTKFPAAAAIWGAIAAAATLLAALKPILQMDAKIKRYSSLFSAYRQLALSMKMVVDEIAEAAEYPAKSSERSTAYESATAICLSRMIRDLLLSW